MDGIAGHPPAVPGSVPPPAREEPPPVPDSVAREELPALREQAARLREAVQRVAAADEGAEDGRLYGVHPYDADLGEYGLGSGRGAAGPGV